VTFNAWTTPCLFFVLAGTFLLTSCGKQPSSTNSGDHQTTSVIPPFPTREPAHYKAVRTLTFVDASGNSTITKTSIARYDDLRREETQSGNSQLLVLLDSEEGSLILLPDAKIYAVVGAENESALGPELDNSPERLLHQAPVATGYQKLGAEAIGNRTATKYQAVVNTPGDGNVSNRETLIWIDESLGMPIKSERAGKDGSRVIMEMSDILLDVDKSFFQMPAGYKKVAIADLRGHLSKNK